MALTITNTNTIQLLNILNKNSATQSTIMKQLTTGRRITSGKDDPAGMIALSGLNAELRAVQTSLANNQRTDSMLTVADQAIGEISNLLGEIETLVMGASSGANLTATDGDGIRYLKLHAGGPNGRTFIDGCIWPEKPADEDCGQNNDND